MLGKFSRLLSKKSTKVQDSCRLGVETLEERCCPDGSHITCGAVVQAGHLVALTGSITGGQVAGISVFFSGAVSGGTSTDSNGNYTYTTSNAALGTVTAVGKDSTLTTTTDTAQATVADNTPSLSLTLASVSKNTVTLTGHLTDVDLAGQTISFSGVAPGSTTTDASGNFSFTAVASALGTISASETDLWGKTSNTATVTVTDNAPVIQGFEAIHEVGNSWVFEGHVVADSSEGMTVTFGGLTALNGQSTTVDSHGDFSFVCFINPGDLGRTATAVTTDWWGLTSATVGTRVG